MLLRPRVTEERKRSSSVAIHRAPHIDTDQAVNNQDLSAFRLSFSKMSDNPAYNAALDREERASDIYAALLRQAAPPTPQMV